MRVAGQEVAGDAIIVALGAELAPERIPGLTEAGHNFYTLDGALRARGALAAVQRGRVVVLTAAPAYKCPAAPYEMAVLADDLLRRRGVRHRVAVEIHAAEAAPMATAGPAASTAVAPLLASRDIAYHPGRHVRAVDPAVRRLAFDGGAELPFDVLLAVPPHCAPSVVVEAGLTDASGWVPVDRGTMATRVPRVFAIGDVTTIPLSMGKPLPKAGVFAHSQGEIVADNLAVELAGRAGTRRFDGWGACFIEAGRGLAAYGAGNFYAEPVPAIRMYVPRRWWHWGKVLLERRWLAEVG